MAILTETVRKCNRFSMASWIARIALDLPRLSRKDAVRLGWPVAVHQQAPVTPANASVANASVTILTLGGRHASPSAMVGDLVVRNHGAPRPWGSDW